MKKQILLFALLITCTWLYARETTAVREYTFRAGANDSRITARESALQQMKLQWLQEDIGMLMQSFTHVSGSEQGRTITQSFSRRMEAHAIGVVRAREIDSRWDGETFWIRAELSADMEQIRSDLDNLRLEMQAEMLRYQQRSRSALVAEPTPEPQSFFSRGHSSYLAWGAISLGYPFNVGTSIVGRHGGIVGFGYFASFGVDIGGRSTYRSSSRNNRSNRKVVSAVHYSLGAKFFPYKNIFLSAGFGTIGMERMHTFNDDDGRFGTDGWRQGTGLSLMVGYNLLGNVGDGAGGVFLSIGAGMSYDFFMGQWQPTVSLRFGPAWHLSN